MISAPITATAGSQTWSSVSCPWDSGVVGGGAIVSSSSTAVSLSSSYPDSNGHSWIVAVNNDSGSSDTVHVYADCLRLPKAYSVQDGGEETTPAGTQTTVLVACPAGTVVYGGGARSSSSALSVTLSSSEPSGNDWEVAVNNAGTAFNIIHPWVVCAKAPKKYAVVSASASTVAAGTQAGSSVACPSGTTFLGGGGYSDSGLTTVSLNSSIPSGTTGWLIWENNNSSSTDTISASAVCGKV